MRQAGFNGSIVIHDGFLGSGAYVGEFPQADYPGLVLDLHNYVVFTEGAINTTHSAKVDFACSAWSTEITASTNAASGFGGPTIVGEWSIAETDCAPWLNNVGTGYQTPRGYRMLTVDRALWDGSLSSAGGQAWCPAITGCECTDANAPGDSFSTEYKTFLNNFFYAQVMAPRI